MKRQRNDEVGDMSASDVEVWVRLEDETDEQAHLVAVAKTGFVAHLIKNVCTALSISEKDVKGISLNNTLLSTRTKLDSLDLTNSTFIILRKTGSNDLTASSTENKEVVEVVNSPAPPAEPQPSADAPKVTPPEDVPEDGLRQILPAFCFVKPQPEVKVKISYRCLQHPAAKTIDSVSLFSTLKELKRIIAKNENIEISDQVAIDLHVRSFGLLFHKKTETLTLAELGFNELMFNTDDTIGLENNMLYVVFRSSAPTTSNKQEWGRLDMSTSWNPFQKKQSEQGMTQFLSALYVISKYLDQNGDEANFFMGHLYTLIKFPPTILALYCLMKNKKLYAEQKAALVNGLFIAFRSIVPRQVCADDSKIFEHSLNAFGYLLNEGRKQYDHVNGSVFETVSLTCPLTFAQLLDPVRITNSKKNQAYNRKSIIDRMPGGSLFIETSPFAVLTPDRIAPDSRAKLLLLYHPFSDDVIIMTNYNENQSEGPRSTPVQLNEWFKIASKTENINILKITPPLALRNAAAPVLTKDDKGKICVYVGPEPCSVGTAVLYNPYTKQSKSVRPDDLAKTLGQAGEAVDNREVTEAIMVCLDTSGSMDDYSFSKEDNEDEKIDIEMTPTEVENEIKEISKWEWIPILKNLFKTKRNEVFAEIAAEGMIAKFITENYKEKLSRFLMDPFLVVIQLDMPLWPVNCNFLQWLPDTVLNKIYEIVQILPEQKTEFSLPIPRNPITVNFISLKGDKKWSFEVDRTFKVSLIKKALIHAQQQHALQSSSSSSQQQKHEVKLIFRGSFMEDGNTLGDYDVVDGSTVSTVWTITDIVEEKKQIPRVADADPEREDEEEDGGEDEEGIGGLFGDDDDDENDVSRRDNEGEENFIEITITTEHDEKDHVLRVDANRSIQYLRYILWEQLDCRPSQFSLWQGFQDVNGWAERAYVDENSTIDTLLDSDDAIRYGPRDRKKVDPRLTRLETVKQLFHAFINRSQAYDYPHQIGLILFNNKVKQACPLTPLFEVFRDHVDKAYADGGTNLYGAINTAGHLLVNFKLKHEKASLRILCFTDGEDTLRTVNPEPCAATLRMNGIILDAIMIGEGKNNEILRAIAKSTGGYAFAPQTLTEALNLNELETLLAVSERPPGKIEDSSTPDFLKKYADLTAYPWDICTRDSVPSRKMPTALQLPVVDIETALQKASDDASSMDLEEGNTATKESSTDAPSDPATSTAAAKNTESSKERVRHIMKELRLLAKNPHPNFDIFPTQDDIGFWRLVMEVDEGSHYSGGTWLLYVEFPLDYPLKAPEIRFVTPIRHSNVNQYGKICHSIFNRNWTADTTMHTVLQCIYGLMLNPDTDDPLDTNLALSFFSASGDYEAAIMKHVEKFAKQKNRDAWKKEFEQENRNQ